MGTWWEMISSLHGYGPGDEESGSKSQAAAEYERHTQRLAQEDLGNSKKVDTSAECSTEVSSIHWNALRLVGKA